MTLIEVTGPAGIRITIEGYPTEIAALVLELQERRDRRDEANIELMVEKLISELESFANSLTMLGG